MQIPSFVVVFVFATFFAMNAAIAAPPATLRLTHDGLLKQRPEWSPDGNWLSFSRHEGSTIFCFLRSADGMTEKRLTKRDMPEFDASWSPDGQRLVFAFDKMAPNQGDIDVYSIGLDGESLTAVLTSNGKLSHEEWPAWSPDGKWIALTSTRDGNQEIYVVSVDGQKVRRLTNDPAIDTHPAWSPDGKKIAFATNRWGDLEIAVVRFDGTGLMRMTDSKGLDDYPTWSPDGKRIAFTSNRDGNLEIYSMTALTKQPRNETQHPAIDNFPTWTRDGKITFVSNRDGGFDLYTLEKP